MDRVAIVVSNRAAYAIILFSALLADFAGNAALGSLPLALAREGSSDGAVALAMGSGMFVALMSAIPIGALVDRFGRLLTLRVAALGAYNLAFNVGMASGALIAAACAHFGWGYTTAIAVCAIAPVRRYARSAAG